jgi:serine/threonine protein kinase
VIEALLGSGAMGVVYRARHVRMGREVAIKVLHDHLVRDPMMLVRFDREAAITAKLDHPNVVTVLDVGETDAGQKLMIMDLVRGESLADILSRGALDRARVIRLVSQLLRGLDHAHAAGLVHRDLKPENVIVERDDCGEEVSRIVDFGIAVLREYDGSIASQRLTAANVALGTPAYMAPEQAHGDAPDVRCDLFALGVMVYEMLCGKQPFEGSSIEIILANISRDPPPITYRTPGATVDPLLEAFARRLMARRLQDRFATARDALAVLRQIERDRDAAAASLGIVIETPIIDTAPHVDTAATRCIPVHRRQSVLAWIVGWLRTAFAR